MFFETGSAGQSLRKTSPESSEHRSRGTGRANRGHDNPSAALDFRVCAVGEVRREIRRWAISVCLGNTPYKNERFKMFRFRARPDDQHSMDERTRRPTCLVFQICERVIPWNLVLVVAILSCHQQLQAAARPNIIYIMVDDLGYGDLGCFGQKVMQTPNLDSMATEKMRVTDHYAGHTVCRPSRLVLWLGQHVGHTGLTGNRPRSLTSTEPTVAKFLKNVANESGTTRVLNGVREEPISTEKLLPYSLIRLVPDTAPSRLPVFGNRSIAKQDLNPAHSQCSYCVSEDAVG
ncbi:MAG: hypothetical protein ACI8P0_000258 [Planctomycetaceae bacterium]